MLRVICPFLLLCTVLVASTSCSPAVTVAGLATDSGIAADYEAYEAARKAGSSTPFIKASGPNRFKAWKLAAEAGDAKAMVLAARCLQEGTGVTKDENEAVQWFRKAADAGNARAMTSLGYCHEYGEGLNKDAEEAVRWYRKAAEAGDAWAMVNLGDSYASGAGVTENEKEAMQWYRKGAEMGDARAMCNLGVCYEYGRGVDKDVTQAVRWFRNAAEAGNADAMCNLGVCYEHGTGVVQDVVAAAEWYRKGANAGYATSMCNLGICYEYGRGVDKDMTEAIRWFQKSCEAGDGRAMCKLGICYAEGTGVAKDEKEAVRWYRQGADAGNATAMFYLGLCYDHGKGVPKDEAQAVRWYRQGAEAGDGTAMANLGVCFLRGQGIDKDEKQAVDWFRKGAEAGDETAMANLAYCYKHGTGVEKDLAQAEAWERKVAEAQGKSKEIQESPLHRMIRAITAAKAPSEAKEAAAITRLPTIDEYLAASWKQVFDEDKTNDAEAHYRIGCLMEIAGPHPIFTTEALEEASKEFLVAAADPAGKSEYAYMHYRMEFLLSTAPDPKKDERVVTLFNMLIDKDLRYYVYSKSSTFFNVNYLVLLLEDGQYADLALHELQTLPQVQLATVPQYLNFPRYCGTQVEELLLKAIAGREVEIASETKTLLENLTNVQYPLIERYRSRLVISDVETFSEQEIKEMRGGRRQAERIRGGQLERVAATTRPAFDYLRSRIELLQGIVDRAEKAASAN